MKTILTTGWSFMRVFRLVSGLAALIFAVVTHDALLGFAGSFLLFMGIFNFGCCGVSGCSVPAHRSKANIRSEEPEKISYEEIT